MFKSVKARFSIIVLLSLGAMLILIFSLKMSLDRLSLLTLIDKKIGNMHLQILDLRKDEKNFFIRKDMLYLNKFDTDLETFTSNTKEIANLLKVNTKTDEILRSLSNYETTFKNITAAYIRQGLDNNSGLRGKLREDAHNLEKILKTKPNLQVILLQIRRHEKDFLNRKSQESADQQYKYFLLLQKSLTLSSHKVLLQAYEDSFKALYQLRIEIGMDNSKGHVFKMLTAAQAIEKEIKIATAQMVPIIQKERDELKRTTYMIFSITSFILVLFIIISVRKLSISFDRFIKFFKEAKRTHSHLDKKESEFSEFSELSIYANEMINARVKAEAELNDLNLHLEERVAEGIKEIQDLNKEIVDTQKEVVFTMGAIGESRSKETGNHVKRVAQYSYILAKAYGLSQHECDILREASPMHDIGKVAIPDSILNKPGPFNDEERAIMDTHAELGYEMLRHSSRELLLAAATVANEHHEKYNGKGYPRALKGEDIHIYGRITAIADVFDALGSDRCYKKAWEDERIFTLFKEERGEHFDPKLIDCFFDNLDEVLKVRDAYKDEFIKAS